MVRNARSRARQRNIWAQVGVSAAVLLLPPIALGAAVYAMLPTREEAASPPATRTVANSQATAQLPAAETLPVAAEAPQFAAAQPAAAAPPSRTATAAKPVATAPSFSLASARQEAAGKAAAKDVGVKNAATKDAATKDGVTKDVGTKDAVSSTGKDTARVLGPVPVRVTVVVPPSAAAPPPAIDADSTPTGSINPEPARIAAAEVPEPEPPLAQVPAMQGATAQSPTSELPPTTATTARRRGRFSYLRHLARRSNLHAEARAARWSARSDHAFSLRNWFNNIGTTSRQRNARN
jgi:hypothetical protein